jgi:hypothetical protein
MKKLVALMMLLACVMVGQEKKWQQKVFDVKYADVTALTILVRGSMGSRSARVLDNVPLKAISVGSDEAADLVTAEELIKRYDVPQGRVPTRGDRNIEVTVYMLLAGKKSTVGEAVPLELDGVAKQLKSVFGYSDLRLLDSTIVRTREGVPAETTGSAGVADPSLPNVPPSIYQLRFRSASLIAGDRGTIIRIDGFRFGFRIYYVAIIAPPGQTQQYTASELGFNTELDVREGQKVVVGKSKVDNNGNAFVLVVTAKGVD